MQKVNANTCDIYLAVLKLVFTVKKISINFHVTIIANVSGQCTLPDFLVATHWWTEKHLVHFYQHNMTGWDVMFNETRVINDWDCYHTVESGEQTFLILQ